MSNPQEELVQTQEQPQVQENTEQANDDIQIVEESSQSEELVREIEQKQFDPKTDKVDFSTPEQQEKFNHVYKQMKMSDTRNQMLTDMLQKQQERLEDLENRFKNTDSAEAEHMLLRKIKDARDRGDDMAEISATNQLIDFKADKKISEKMSAKPAQASQVDPNVNYVSHSMNERDNGGNLLRPYLYEGHADFEASVDFLERVASKYDGDPQAVPKSLAELDNFMRSKMTNTQKPSGPSPRTPNPMQGGNLTNVNKKTTIKMTGAELAIARKLGIDPKRYAAKRDEINAKGKK